MNLYMNWGDVLYDVVIIGSGPAGLSAALYAKRAMLNVVVFEQLPLSGGQIINTNDVDNYIGLPGIGGFELAQKFREHIDGYGVEVRTASVNKIEDMGEYKIVTVNDSEKIETRTVVIATGTKNKKLGVAGEQELIGKGVSYCATCDGAFYKGKTVAVVGGGDVALEDAIYLSRICEKVYLIHRRDEFRGAKILSDNAARQNNIEIILNTTVERIIGENRVEGIEIKNKIDLSTETLNIDGLFLAVGTSPNSESVKDLVDTDKSGYIIADETCQTSVAGIFAAGDIRTKRVRQVVTAVADGAACIDSVERYLLEK